MCRRSTWRACEGGGRGRGTGRGDGYVESTGSRGACTGSLKLTHVVIQQNFDTMKFYTIQINAQQVKHSIYFEELRPRAIGS